MKPLPFQFEFKFTFSILSVVSHPQCLLFSHDFACTLLPHIRNFKNQTRDINIVEDPSNLSAPGPKAKTGTILPVCPPVSLNLRTSRLTTQHDCVGRSSCRSPKLPLRVCFPLFILDVLVKARHFFIRQEILAYFLKTSLTLDGVEAPVTLSISIARP